MRSHLAKLSLMYSRIVLLGLCLSTALITALAGANSKSKIVQPAASPSTSHLNSNVSEKCWSVARLKYGGGGDWYAGPTMLVNLSKRLQSDLGLTACEEEKSVGLLDGNLYAYPILFLTGHGNVAFAEEERKVLREYLMRGGLLFADDNYGMDTSFRREMKILFPNHPMVPMGLHHPVFKAYYKFPQGLPKIHQHDGKHATAYGIVVEGRTVVFYSYESDLGNGWEDLDVHKDGPELHETALRMGVNVVAWFLQGARPEAEP
jgi:DNA-directed RNA polymerase subunit H (RpoH/RPB5)